MKEQGIPNYTDDWKRYWEFRYGQRIRTQLKKAAENPVREFLPMKPSQLNPPSDEHEWAIEIQHLKESPDSVLSDARSGFREFAYEKDIADEKRNHYDILPVNFTEDNFNLNDYFWSARTFDRIEPNRISRISVELTGPVEKIIIPVAISYCCPEGHRTRIVQPVFTRKTIKICPEGECSNSVYPVSQNTQFQPVISFNALFNNTEFEVIAAGINVEDRILDELVEKDGSLNIVGILRNVIHSDDEPKRVYEALNMLTS